MAFGKYLRIHLGTRPEQLSDFRVARSASEGPHFNSSLTRRVTTRKSFWMYYFLTLMLTGIGCQTAAHSTVRLPARHSVHSEQLLVLSDVRLDKDHPLIADLIQLRKDVGRILELPMKGRPVVVYLFSDETNYRRFLQAKYPGLPPRRAYFVGSPDELAVYTFWGDRIQEDLRHEFTHGLLHSDLRYVPLWLDEGLAECFEVAGPQPGSINVEYAGRLASLLSDGWRPNMKRLERLETVGEMRRDDYQEAWAWVHYLLNESPEKTEILLRYLEQLRHAPHPGPLSEHLLEEFPNADQRFLSYVASLNTFRGAAVLQTVGH